MKFYDNVTNHFPDELVIYVVRVPLYDDPPFEYEFFVQIAQSFPKKSKNVHTQDLSIIEYPHHYQAQYDYVEQFLINTEICSSNNIHLCVNYEAQERITENFTRHATRINCAKLCYLHFIWSI
ncbi:unnamed protein product [Rotaria sp. Silwood1]|nr:unnamed protein product [Rotaria sp. Silwood1]